MFYSSVKKMNIRSSKTETIPSFIKWVFYGYINTYILNITVYKNDDLFTDLKKENYY